MAKHSRRPLKGFLADAGVSQADLARGIKMSTAFVSMLCNGGSDPSPDTIDAILLFLSARLKRPVTYEETLRKQARSRPMAGVGAR